MLGQPEQAPVAAGEVLAGKYRVERIVAQGGMGVVAAATHIDLGELRAIKFMKPAALANEKAEARFLREARASAKLRSEHIVKIHDIGRLDDGVPYLVMEFLEGDNLKAVLAEHGPFSITMAVDFILQAIEGLAEAHAAGIVHRDLKPPNLFVTRGNDGQPFIKVLDFGISKLTGALAEEAGMDLTHTTMMMGSPLYMSPEQMASARDIDARCDIWALGVIFYELLTGKRPFRGKTITAVTMDVATREAGPPSALRNDIPPELDAVVARCLEKDPARRYATVVELAEALAPFAAAESRPLIDRARRVQHLGPVALPRPSLLSAPDHTPTIETPISGSGIRSFPPQPHSSAPPASISQPVALHSSPALGPLVEPDEEATVARAPEPVFADRDSPTVVMRAEDVAPPSPRAPVLPAADDDLARLIPTTPFDDLAPPRRGPRTWLAVPLTIGIVGALSAIIAVVALQSREGAAPTTAAPSFYPPAGPSDVAPPAPEPEVAPPQDAPDETPEPRASAEVAPSAAPPVPRVRPAAPPPEKGATAAQPAPPPRPKPGTKKDPFGESWR